MRNHPARVCATILAVEGDGDFAISGRLCVELRSFLTYSQVETPLQPGDVLHLRVDPADLFEIE